MKVQSVYDRVCQVLCEPGGLQAGCLTLDDFLGFFGQVIAEFAQAGGLCRRFFGQAVTAAVGTYTLPDEALDVEQAYYNGRALALDDALDLDVMAPAWRTRSGVVKNWHLDRLDPKNIEIVPKPGANGASVTSGAGFYGTLGVTAVPGPDVSFTSAVPFYGVVASFAGPDSFEPNGILLGTFGGLTLEPGNLLEVATTKPPAKTWRLDDLIECVPDSFCLYLAYGVLAKVFSLDGELRDELRQRYCAARFFEGVSLAKAMTDEVLESEG